MEKVTGTVYKMLDRQGNLITKLFYKPKSDDLIRVDKTGNFYKVATVDPEKRTCVADRSVEAEMAYR